MTNGNKAKPGEPSEVELLLPWHAAGTLGPQERQLVEAALADDPELASHYEWVRSEFAQETSIGDAAGALPQRCANTVCQNRCAAGAAAPEFVQSR